MLVHPRVIPSIKFASTDFCKPGWREALWGLSVLPKNTTKCPQPELEPGLHIPESSPLTMRSLCLRLNILIVHVSDNKNNSRSWLVLNLRVSICHIINARSRGCPIAVIRFELFVIGYPCDLLVNYARFHGFLLDVSYSFQNLWKTVQMSSLKRRF